MQTNDAMEIDTEKQMAEAKDELKDEEDLIRQQIKGAKGAKGASSASGAAAADGGGGGSSSGAGAAAGTSGNGAAAAGEGQQGELVRAWCTARCATVHSRCARATTTP